SEARTFRSLSSSASPARAGPARQRQRTTLLASRLKPLRDLVPVHDVPPRGEVVRALVLVLEVVRVLPDVVAEERGLPLHERRVLVGRALDRELAAAQEEPRPAAAEALGAG